MTAAMYLLALLDNRVNKLVDFPNQRMSRNGRKGWNSLVRYPNSFIACDNAGLGEMVFVSMDGNSITCAPNARSLSASRELFSLGRVIKICLPPSGRSSAQWNRSASAHTSPTRIMAGVPISAFFASFARFPTVETTRRWEESVPFSKTAAGTEGSIPASISPIKIVSMEEIPIRNTSVPFRFTREG